MANTYTAIATVTVGSGGAADIEFTSIPGTYTDLALKVSVRGSSNLATQQMYLTFNGTTTNFSAKQIYGDGASATSATLSNSGAAISIINTNTSAATANTFSSTDIYIPNYAGSTNKSVIADSVTENNGATALAGLSAGLWSNSAAITSLKLTPQDGGTTYLQHSTATLYGIKKN
jgi:hypothetical protein